VGRTGTHSLKLALEQLLGGRCHHNGTVSDGWEPICERLGVAVPNEVFPATNSTNETRAILGMPAV
jgi:Sulfotransferase domain